MVLSSLCYSDADRRLVIRDLDTGSEQASMEDTEKGNFIAS